MYKSTFISCPHSWYKARNLWRPKHLFLYRFGQRFTPICRRINKIKRRNRWTL